MTIKVFKPVSHLGADTQMLIGSVAEWQNDQIVFTDIFLLSLTKEEDGEETKINFLTPDRFFTEVNGNGSNKILHVPVNSIVLSDPSSEIVGLYRTLVRDNRA